jgi:serine/threonine protein kinase
LLISESNVVYILDFNVSKRREPGQKMMTKTGTVQFSAPEIFCQSEYDEKIDVWSAGVILYMMLSGTQPFFDQSMPRLVKKISTEEPNFDLPAFKQVSKYALDLL